MAGKGTDRTSTTLHRELEERHRKLKADIAIALAEAEAGLAEPLDVEMLKRELRGLLDKSETA